MRCLTLTYLSCLISLMSFGQYQDTWQPPSIYKLNGVKARVIMYDRASFKERAVVDYFNRDGYVTEHTEYDSTGRNPVSVETFSYDSTHKMTSHIIRTYQHYDPDQKKFIPYEVPKETAVYNEYDTQKRVIKQTGKSKEGKVVFEAAYTFHPLSKTIKQFRNDTLISETQVQYEVPWLETAYTQKIYNMDGSAASADHTFRFKNHLDKSGRITRRKVSYEGPIENLIYYKEISYQYMISGLLIRKESSNRSDGANVMSGQLFDYKFW